LRQMLAGPGLAATKRSTNKLNSGFDLIRAFVCMQ